MRDLEHCATPLRKSVMAELEQAFPDDFARTAASRFRSATDISVTNSLYHYYALMTGRAVTTTRPRVRYVQTTLASSRSGAWSDSPSAPTSTCSASTTAATPRSPRRCACARCATSLERMFPVRAPWERDELSEARGIGSVGASLRAALSGGDPGGAQPALRLVGVDVLQRAGRVDRHDRVHDGVVVDVHEVERLRAVLRAGAADGNREVLRVAGG